MVFCGEGKMMGEGGIVVEKEEVLDFLEILMDNCKLLNLLFGILIVLQI